MNQLIENLVKLNTKGIILRKINISFTVHFCLSKYSFSLSSKKKNKKKTSTFGLFRRELSYKNLAWVCIFMVMLYVGNIEYFWDF